MPHFSDCCPGRDEYICQVCATVKCSGCKNGEWLNLKPFTGINREGNVCQDCIKDQKSTESLSSKNVNPGLRLCRPFQNRKAGAHYWDVNTGQDAGPPTNLEFNPEGICPRHRLQTRQSQPYRARHLHLRGTPQKEEGLMNLVEYCRIESGGLTGQALQDYINRYYGHG